MAGTVESPRGIPEWAARERQQDLQWLNENLHVLWPAASRGFALEGRGAVGVDTNTLVSGEAHSGNPMFYFSQELVEQNGWADVVRMVRSYDPSWELVTVLLKNNRESAYRIRVPSERKSVREGA